MKRWMQSAGMAFLFLVFPLAVTNSQETTSPVLPAPQLWFYYSTNLLVDANLNRLETIFRRAAQAGYTHVFLRDSKFDMLAGMLPNYFLNIERVKKLAKELKLEIVPGLFPMGYSDSLLTNDPNLVESLPVRDALFIVQKGAAFPENDPQVDFKGGFENLREWQIHDPTVRGEDEGIVHIRKAAGKNARLGQRITVHPYRLYHVSVKIKTKDYTAQPVMIQVLDKQGQLGLNFADLDVKPTQDWTIHHAVFNSLNNDEVVVTFRAGWTGSDGDLWMATPAIDEAGLVNLVRRDGAPFVVKEEGGATLVEGKDFQEVSDPKLGNDGGRGEFGAWHEPLPIRTHQTEGTRLRVSFNHAMTTDQGKVMICPSEPRTLEILRDSAKRLHAAFKAKSYFMGHDEIRVLNWDDSCVKRKLEAGPVLADNVRVCTQILDEVNPGGGIYVWSDMFDPNHNAHTGYYLVRGSLKDSWEGLDPKIVIANWNFEKRAESLAWFAGRGHHQLIAGYYDQPGLDSVREWCKAAKAVSNVDAIMYTTWKNNYDHLEEFAAIVKESWGR
jgi:hypothetical protein